MYLFTRMTRLAPGKGSRLGLEWAIGITEKVNQITSLNVGLWSPILSPGVGTLSWGASVESLGDLEDADAKLNVDALFVEAVEAGAEYTVGGVDDETAQFIFNPESSPSTSHVSVVRAQISNGNIQRGIEVGVEIAQRATTLGGSPTSFLLSTTGTYAGCAWISSATSIRELEASEQKVNGDAAFIAYLDKESGCYQQGNVTQSIWRRVV